MAEKRKKNPDFGDKTAKVQCIAKSKFMSSTNLRKKIIKKGAEISCSAVFCTYSVSKPCISNRDSTGSSAVYIWTSHVSESLVVHKGHGEINLN